jgi:hypothetical protein
LPRSKQERPVCTSALAITINNYLSSPDSLIKNKPVTKTGEGTSQKNSVPYLVASMLCSNQTPPVTITDPSSINPCILCKEDSHKCNNCPLLNNDEFMKGFIIKLVTGILCELHQGKNKLKTANTHIHQLLADQKPDHSKTPDLTHQILS